MFKEKKWTLIVISTFLTVIVIIYILSYINNRDFEDFLNGIPIILTLVMFLVGYPVEEYTRKKWPGNVQNKPVYPLVTRKKWTLIGGLAYGTVSLVLLTYFLVYFYSVFTISGFEYFYLVLSAIIAVIAAFYFRDYVQL